MAFRTLGRERRIAVLLALTLGVLAPGPARALGLALDPAQSSLDTTAGSAPLSGSLSLSLGATPPLVANTTFDLTAAAVSGGGLTITLDPDLAGPGLGVLRPDGSFLVPTLFLRVDDGGGALDLTVLDVEGTFGPGAASGGADCLQASFAFDGGAVAGTATIVAGVTVPEPAAALLLGLAAAGLLAGARLRPERPR